MLLECCFECSMALVYKLPLVTEQMLLVLQEEVREC
jgi:hypothetical protein